MFRLVPAQAAPTPAYVVGRESDGHAFAAKSDLDGVLDKKSRKYPKNIRRSLQT